MTRPTEEQILEAGEDLACAARGLLECLARPSRDAWEHRVAVQDEQDALHAAINAWNKIYEASV